MIPGSWKHNQSVQCRHVERLKVTLLVAAALHWAEWRKYLGCGTARYNINFYACTHVQTHQTRCTRQCYANYMQVQYKEVGSSAITAHIHQFLSACPGVGDAHVLHDKGPVHCDASLQTPIACMLFKHWQTIRPRPDSQTRKSKILQDRTLSTRNPDRTKGRRQGRTSRSGRTKG